MQEFAPANRTNILGIQSHQSDGASISVNDFNFVCGTFLVDMHDGTYVACEKSFLGNVTIKYDDRMFSEHWLHPGYAVTSLGGEPFSTIQTETTMVPIRNVTYGDWTGSNFGRGIFTP